MKQLSAKMIGIITGAAMILVSMGIFYFKGNFENSLQYITYAIYILGILWAIYQYIPPAGELPGFKHYFTQGFMCFIIVTLMMVIFTYIFIKLNPQLKEEMAVNYKIQLESTGNLTPNEINSSIERAKDYYSTMLIAATSFGYLLIGALISVILAVFFSQKRQQKKTDF